MRTLRTLMWCLLTGGLHLLRLPEHQPFRVVRVGRQLDVEPIPSQRTDPATWFAPQDRVHVLSHAGFYSGSMATVEYHAPDGKVWARVDGTAAPAFFHPHELELERTQHV